MRLGGHDPIGPLPLRPRGHDRVALGHDLGRRGDPPWAGPVKSVVPACGWDGTGKVVKRTRVMMLLVRVCVREIDSTK